MKRDEDNGSKNEAIDAYIIPISREADYRSIEKILLEESDDFGFYFDNDVTVSDVEGGGSGGAEAMPVQMAVWSSVRRQYFEVTVVSGVHTGGEAWILFRLGENEERSNEFRENCILQLRTRFPQMLRSEIFP